MTQKDEGPFDWVAHYRGTSNRGQGGTEMPRPAKQGQDPTDSEAVELEGESLPAGRGESLGRTTSPKDREEPSQAPSANAEPKQEQEKKDEEKDGGGAGEEQSSADEVDLVALRAQIVPDVIEDISFDDIKGQDKAVAKMKVLDRQLQHPEVYAKWGASVPRGILLEGPPGTGKTMMATAIANSANYAFLSASCADVSSRWYGQTEKIIDGIFEVADREAKAHPSGRAILFLDEVEALLRSRDKDSHEASEKVLSIVLQRMNGLKSSGNVTVIAATNRKDKLDSAFRSRMNEEIHVPLPDETGVAAILEARFQKREKEGEHQILSDDIDFDMLGEQLVGSSGRNLEDLANAVGTEKANQEVAELEQPEEEREEVGPVTTRDVIAVVVESGKYVDILGRKKIAELRAEFNVPEHVAEEEEAPAATAESEAADEAKANEPEQEEK